ncbi:hypothetical protein WJX72_009045 [[Myrmecia] bisecta]|uniref:Uncharacterized protein n=1 Tax=[Myrmecia] bisecta TaxID=41462 RepID=A0AAW1PQ07_9CHLO
MARPWLLLGLLLLSIAINCHAKTAADEEQVLAQDPVNEQQRQVDDLSSKLKEAEGAKVEEHALLQTSIKQLEAVAKQQLGEITVLKKKLKAKDSELTAKVGEHGAKSQQQQAKLAALQDELEASQKDASNAAALEADLKEAAKQLEAAEAKLRAADGEAKELAEKIATAEAAAAAAKRELKSHAGTAKAQSALEEEVTALKAQLAAAAEQLKEQTARADSAGQALKIANKEHGGAAAKVAGLEQQLAVAKEAEARAKAALGEQSQKLKSQEDELKGKTKEMERSTRKLEKLLKTAQAEAEAAKAAVEQEKARADEAVRKAHETLQQHMEEWLPAWLVHGYEKVRAKTEPHVRWLCEQTSAASHAALHHTQAALHFVRAKAGEAYIAAGPHAQAAFSKAKAVLADLQKGAHKVAGPGLDAAMGRLSSAFDSVSQRLSKLADAPQLLKVRRQAHQTLTELIRFASGHLRRIPALAPYSKPPYVNYLVYGVLASPLITLILSMLVFRGSKQSAAQSSYVGPSGAAKAPASAAKKQRGRKISVGGETIYVPE